MKSISKAFTEYLKKLSQYADKLQEGTATYADYEAFQAMAVDVWRAHERGAMTYEERRALDSIYYHLGPCFRACLGMEP